MPEHGLDEIVQATFGVRAVDVEEPLYPIEKENHERVVSSSQGRDVTPTEIGDRLDDEPGDGVITVDANQVVQDSVAVHGTGRQGVPVHGRRRKGASAHLRFQQTNRHVRRVVSERGLELADLVSSLGRTFCNVAEHLVPVWVLAQEETQRRERMLRVLADEDARGSDRDGS